MCSKSITKTTAQVLFVTIALFVAAASPASAQGFFNGQGLSSGSSSPFSNPRSPQFDQPVSNPFSGIFKKPAFLENLNLSSLDFKKPNIQLPNFGNLIPQREPVEQTMLGKMKTKTDAFFSKALAFEKLVPGRQPEAPSSSANWESVRKSMEDILAGRGEENPIRSAGGFSDTIRR